MKTLYDLLGARPDDDAEALRAAFRKAAKANHPDLHVGDPDAPLRFRQIVETYDILRDVQQRATYDQLLKFERQQLHWKLTRTLAYLKRNILSDAIAVVSLAIVLGGGWTLFAYVSKTRVDAVNLAQVTTAGPASAKIAAVPPAARADTTETDGLRDRFYFTAMSEMPIVLPPPASAGSEGAAPAPANGGLAPGSAGTHTQTARPDKGFDVPIQQADIEADADRPAKNPVVQPVDQERPQSVEVPFSYPEKDNVSPEKDNGVAKSTSSALAMSGDERDMEAPGTPDAGTGHVSTSNVKISDAKTVDAKISEARTPDTKISDAKMPETKTPARRRTMAKRQATGGIAFEQVSLENKNTPACSGPCSGNAPPLFGVGF